MRAHEQPRAVDLEVAARSWPPVEPMALRWEFPVWRIAPDLDPAALRSEKPKRAKSTADEFIETPAWSAELFVETFIGTEPITLPELRERAAVDTGLS